MVARWAWYSAQNGKCFIPGTRLTGGVVMGAGRYWASVYNVKLLAQHIFDTKQQAVDWVESTLTLLKE